MIYVSSLHHGVCTCIQMGLDSEDLQYLLESYSMLKEDEPDLPYASQPIAFHPPTLDRDRSQMSTPRKRGRPSEGSITDHKTGCARSEGYYKITKAKAVKARLSSQARLIDQVCNYICLCRCVSVVDRVGPHAENHSQAPKFDIVFVYLGT